MTRHNHSPFVLGTFESTIGNQAIAYSVKRSYNARCARLEIKRQLGLTVFIPRYFKLSDVPDLLQSKGKWILNKLAEFNNGNLDSPHSDVCDTFPYLGRQIKVVICHNPEAEDSIVLKNNTLTVCHRNGIVTPELLIAEWYRKQALAVLTDKVNEYCPQLGVRYNRLTVRNARTRWGSCSQKRNLNFNWKLIMVPEPVIEYVVIHELTHLKELNHSKKFWNLVAGHCPEWREHKNWLAGHEHELNAINL